MKFKDVALTIGKFGCDAFGVTAAINSTREQGLLNGIRDGAIQLALPNSFDETRIQAGRLLSNQSPEKIITAKTRVAAALSPDLFNRGFSSVLIVNPNFPQPESAIVGLSLMALGNVTAELCRRSRL